MPIERKATFALIGGMATNVNPLILQDGQAKLLLNYHTEDIGSWTKRNGYCSFGGKLNNFNFPILGMHQFIDSAAVNSRAIAVSNNSGQTIANIYITRTSALTSDVSIGDTVINVVDGSEFNGPGGSVDINGNNISYVQRIGNQLTGVTGITQNHSSGDTARQWFLHDTSSVASTRPSFVTFLNRVFRFTAVDAAISWDGVVANPWDKQQLTSTASGDFTITPPDTLASVAHGLVTNNVVLLTTTGTLPAPLETDTRYFVVEIVDANNFKLSKFSEGDPITITGVGGGTQSFDIDITTNAPFGSVAEAHVFNLYVAGDPTNPDRVYFSSEPDINGNIFWDTKNNWIDINPSDNSNIVALESNQDLLIFKERGLYRLTTTRQTEADLLINIGALNKDVVTTVSGITFWLGRSKEDLGVFAYTGGFPRDIGKPIQKWIDAIDQSNTEALHVGTQKDALWFYLGDSIEIDGDTYSNVYAVFGISRNDWVIYSMNDSMSAAALFVDSDNREKLFTGSSKSAVFQQDRGTDDNGQSIAGRIIAKEFSINAPEIQNKLLNFAVFTEQANGMAVRMILNGEGDPIPVGDIKKRIHILDAPQTELQGHTFQPVFTDNSKQSSKVNGFAFWYSPTGALAKFTENALTDITNQ